MNLDESTGPAAEERTSVRGLIERMVRAALLDLRVFVEVSADRGANGQALMAVLIVGVFNGLGLVPRLGNWGLSAGVGAALLGWFLWTAVIFAIGVTLGQDRDGRSLLRALAFANAPGVLLILGIVPVVGAIARLIVFVWLIAASAVAVQAVYGVSRRRGVAISVLGMVVYLLLGVAFTYWMTDRETVRSVRGVRSGSARTQES